MRITALTDFVSRNVRLAIIAIAAIMVVALRVILLIAITSSLVFNSSLFTTQIASLSGSRMSIPSGNNTNCRNFWAFLVDSRSGQNQFLYNLNSDSSKKYLNHYHLKNSP